MGQVLNNNSDENNAEAHNYFVERASYTLKLLLAYADAMGAVITSGVVDLEAYPNGM